MNIISVVEYQGNNQTMVWKHHMVNVATGSQIIVRDTQEAVIYVNGELLDVLGSGRHTLDTGKLPIITDKLRSLITSGDPFQSEFYFVNKAKQITIRWGLNPKIQFIDKINSNAIFKIGANGSIGFSIADSKEFIRKFIGTENALGIEKLKAILTPKIQPCIVSSIYNLLDKKDISIFELDREIMNISREVREELKEQLKSFCINLEEFSIAGFVYPEEDPNYVELRDFNVKRRNELNAVMHQGDVEIIRAKTDAEKQKIKANANAEEMVTIADATAISNEKKGISAIQIETFKVLDTLAGNEGVGSASSAMNGIAMGAASGVAFGTAFGQLTNVITDNIGENSKNKESRKEVNDEDDYLYIQEENEEDSLAGHKDSFEDRVNKLQYMREKGLISQEDFEAKVNKLMEEI